MKNTVRILTSAMLAATFVACNSGGSGTGAVTPTNAAVSNAQGYVGAANWYGSLQVTNMGAYQQFLQASGKCFGPQCQMTSPWLQVQINTTNTNGYLPGAVMFVLSPSMAGAPISQISGQAQGFMNTGNNGMVLNWYGPYFNNFINYAPNGNVVQPNVSPMLQIAAQYTQNGMAVQAIYQGTAFASGNISGTLQQQQLPYFSQYYP